MLVFVTALETNILQVLTPFSLLFFLGGGGGFTFGNISWEQVQKCDKILDIKISNFEKWGRGREINSSLATIRVYLWINWIRFFAKIHLKHELTYAFCAFDGDGDTTNVRFQFRYHYWYNRNVVWWLLLRECRCCPQPASFVLPSTDPQNRWAGTCWKRHTSTKLLNFTENAHLQKTNQRGTLRALIKSLMKIIGISVLEHKLFRPSGKILTIIDKTHTN